jgi:hypothetical protein
MMRGRRPRLAAATVIPMVLVVAACSGGGGNRSAPTTTKRETTESAAPITLQSRADDACRAALRGVFLNAQATTVGKVRALRGNIVGVHPFEHAFRGAPTSGFAAYCWISHGNDYTSYAVGPHGSSAEIESMSWPYNQSALPRPKPGAPSPFGEI